MFKRSKVSKDQMKVVESMLTRVRQVGVRAIVCGLEFRGLSVFVPVSVERLRVV